MERRAISLLCLPLASGDDLVKISFCVQSHRALCQQAGREQIDNEHNRVLCDLKRFDQLIKIKNIFLLLSDSAPTRAHVCYAS
jgi:hypothetical protein